MSRIEDGLAAQPASKQPPLIQKNEGGRLLKIPDGQGNLPEQDMASVWVAV